MKARHSFLTQNLTLTVCLFNPILSFCQGLEELNDAALDQIYSGDGINWAFQDISLSGNHNITFTPDNATSQALTLQNITLNDGSGGGVSIGNFQNPITVDVDGASHIQVALPSELSAAIDPLQLAIADIAVNGFSLGALFLDQLNPLGSTLGITGHNDGLSLGVGIRLTLETAQIDSAASTLTLTGIHLGSEINADSDPRFPEGSGTTPAWQITDPWQLSTLTNAPLTIDVGSNNGSDPSYFAGLTSNNSSLTDKGYLYIENIRFQASPHFGGADLGAVAVDGLKLETFSAKLPK